MISRHRRTPKETTVITYHKGSTITRTNTNPDTAEIKTPCGAIYTFRRLQGTWQLPEGCPEDIGGSIIGFLKEKTIPQRHHRGGTTTSSVWAATL